MIVDTLDNLERYISLNPLFPEVVKFIKENDLTQLEAGKHPIQGADLFLNIAEAQGKNEEDAVIETHRKMIDIQIPLDNEETYGYTPLKDLPEVEYNWREGADARYLQAGSVCHLLARGRSSAMYRQGRHPQGYLQDQGLIWASSQSNTHKYKYLNL